MMMAKTMVILGGAVGGIVAANHMRRRLTSGHRVVLIETPSAHLHPRSCGRPS